MTLDEIAEDVCVTAFGFRWGSDHDQLHDYLLEVLRRYRAEIYKETDPITHIKDYLPDDIRHS